MKRMLAFSVVAFFLTSLPLRAEETTPLYPLKVGAKWTYKVAGGQIEVKVDKKETFAGQECYKLETSSQGKVSASEYVFVGKINEVLGVYRTGINGLKPDAPIMFLKLPPGKGDHWSIKTKVQGQDVEGEYVIHEADVKVPAGSYPGATLVEGNNFKIAGMDTTIKCWFAKDVGIVKLEFKLGGQDATLELEKYEPGK